jgi:hypothetical protein
MTTDEPETHEHTKTMLASFLAAMTKRVPRRVPDNQIHMEEVLMTKLAITALF